MQSRSRLYLGPVFTILVASFAIIYLPSARSQAKAPAAAPAEPSAAPVSGENLATAPTADLMKIYSQLRNLQGSTQVGNVENTVFKRDAATFTFKDGQLAFAAPVDGHVVAAVFTGDATFELDPPTTIERNQIARFTGQPRLVDSFKKAVFFFTDNSWPKLQKLLTIGSGGDAQATGNALSSTESKYADSFNDWWDNQRKGNFEMRNLPARMLADLTDPSSKGLFLADIHGAKYGNLLYQVSWNRPSILLPDEPNAGQVMLLHYNLGRYYEWWAGFRLSSDYAAGAHPPERSTLIAHCAQENISANISKSNHLSATAQMQFTVPSGTPRVLPFNLAGVLRISSITGPSGKSWGFIQEARNLDSDPWMILPSPAAPGHSYTVKITYAENSTLYSRVITRMGSGLFFVAERTSWYPSFGAADDRTEFHLHFVSPRRYQFIATGRLVDSKKKKTGLVTDYVSQIPFSVVGFNYGQFVEKSVSQGQFKVSVYAGKNLPEQLQGLQGQLSIAEMEQRSVSPRGGDIAASQGGILEGGFNTASGARYAAAKSDQALRLYQSYFGVLPFHTISVTEQPVGDFGQSWPTLIFLPYVSLLDPTTLDSLHLGNTAAAREFTDMVAVHEMAHQWWGHMVGWKSYHDQWLSEGFAQFSAALYLQMYEPKENQDFWDYARTLLLGKDRAGHRPVDIGPIWLNNQLDSRLQPDAASTLIYYKGAYVLEMLRTLLEKPNSRNPDAQFIQIMHDFVQTYAGKNASTQDFERIVNKDTHTNLSWFFNEWVYGTETPTYKFDYSLRPGPKGKTILHLSLTQSQVSPSFAMSVPLDMYVKGKPYLAGFLHVVGSHTVQGNVPLAFHPEKVAIDATHSLLAIETQ